MTTQRPELDWSDDDLTEHMRSLGATGSLPPVLRPGEFSRDWLVPFRTLARDADAVLPGLQSASRHYRDFGASVELIPEKGFGVLRLSGHLSAQDLPETLLGFRERARERIRVQLSDQRLHVLIGVGPMSRLVRETGRKQQIKGEIADLAIDFPLGLLQNNGVDNHEDVEDSNINQEFEADVETPLSVEELLERIDSFVDPLEAVSHTYIIRSIEARAKELESARSRLDRAVRLARIAGVTWANIGKAVGISQQAATSRWKSKSESQ